MALVLVVPDPWHRCARLVELVEGCFHLFDQCVEPAVDLRWCDGLLFYSSVNALCCAV
ncbi:MAG: hypothetical protein ACXWAT_15095 [Methylobacter sp.]